MDKFILIPKDAMRYGLSDVLVNLGSIITMTSREERDIPLIVFEVGEKEVKLSFNNLETRDHFFQFILNECKPISSALPEAVAEGMTAIATEKKRRSHARD